MTDKVLTHQDDNGVFQGEYTPKSDLVERLRSGDATNYGGDLQALLDDAADALESKHAEIERLQVRYSEMAHKKALYGGKIAKLREALQNIVECHEMASEIYTNDTEMADNFADRARAALQKDSE